MPKEVISAAEILGTKAPVTEAEIPVVETAAPSTEAPPAPAAGFEDPPEGEAAAEAPSAASLLSEVAAEAEDPPDVEAEKLAKIEFDAGATLAREGQPLPDGASDKAKEGYLSVAPVLAGKSVEAAVAETENVPPAPATKCWVFVKNIHPGEVIKFKDGSDFVFPRSLFSVFDPGLAEKILAVADRHHIVLQ